MAYDFDGQRVDNEADVIQITDCKSPYESGRAISMQDK